MTDIKITARNYRVNADQRSVWDIYFNDRFQATVEVHGVPVGGQVYLKVLLGALQPRGKELALESIKEAYARG